MSKRKSGSRNQGHSPSSADFEPYRVNACSKEIEVGLAWTVGLGWTERLVMREWRDESNGALSDFVVFQETFDPRCDQWREVSRIDVRHGNAHVHRFNADQVESNLPRPLHQVKTREDLEEAYKIADDFMQNRWEENLRLWRA